MAGRYSMIPRSIMRDRRDLGPDARLVLFDLWCCPQTHIAGAFEWFIPVASKRLNLEVPRIEAALDELQASRDIRWDPAVDLVVVVGLAEEQCTNESSRKSARSHLASMPASPILDPACAERDDPSPSPDPYPTPCPDPGPNPYPNPKGPPHPANTLSTPCRHPVDEEVGT